MDSGINLFDLSEAHSGPRAEKEMGRIAQKYAWKRTSFVLCTKIYWSTKAEERGLSRKHILESVKAMLARLQVEYIDVIIIHKVILKYNDKRFPFNDNTLNIQADNMCPMEEVVRAMNYVITQGWALYWGTAKWSPVEVNSQN